MSKDLSETRLREEKIGRAFIAPALVGFSLFYILPFILCVYFSLTKGVGLNVRFVGLSNFQRLFSNTAFWLGAKNSFLFILVAVPGLLVVSLCLAALLRMLKKTAAFLRLPLLVPLVIPTASLVVIWKWIFADKGAVNFLFSFLHLPDVFWLSEQGAFWMLVLLFIWKYAGYCMLLFSMALSNVPVLYHEAAMLDGAGVLRRFFRITLPELMPTISFALLISVSNSFKIYRECYLLYGENPPSQVFMLQHFMENSFKNLDFSRLSTASVSMLLLFGVLLFAAFRRSGRGKRQ